MKPALYVAYHTSIPLISGQLGLDHGVPSILASQPVGEVRELLSSQSIDVVLITALATSKWIAFEQGSTPEFVSSVTRIVLSRQDPHLLEGPARRLGLDGAAQLDGPNPAMPVIQDIVGNTTKNGTNFDNGSKDPAVVRQLLSIFSISYIDQTDFEIAARVATGATDREIARDVFLSIKTVRNRISGLLSRSGCRNRTELALMHVHSPYATWDTYVEAQKGELPLDPPMPGIQPPVM